MQASVRHVAPRRPDPIFPRIMVFPLEVIIVRGLSECGDLSAIARKWVCGGFADSGVGPGSTAIAFDREAESAADAFVSALTDARRLWEVLLWMSGKGYEIEPSLGDVAAAAMQVNLARSAGNIVPAIERRLRKLVA